MNEYLKTFQCITQSVEPLLTDEYNSPELKLSATSLKQSVEPCFQELKQSATKLKGLVQQCFYDLHHAQDVWHSKQKISELPTHDIWEQIGDLSGRAIRISRLGSQCKLEGVKQVKDYWYARVKRITNQCFYDNKTWKSGLSIFEKDNLIKELNSATELQIEYLKKTVRQSTELIIQELEVQIPFIQKCISQLDGKQKAEITFKLNSITEPIISLVERVFTERLYTLSVNVKGLIDSIKNAADNLAKQGVLGISREQFTKCYEEVATKLETIVVTVFNELVRLATQAIEQALAFYNEFLERQVRYRQETPEQRLAEKAWIEQQRQELARVQNGIEAILN